MPWFVDNISAIPQTSMYCFTTFELKWNDFLIKGWENGRENPKTCKLIIVMKGPPALSITRATLLIQPLSHNDQIFVSLIPRLWHWNGIMDMWTNSMLALRVEMDIRRVICQTFLYRTPHFGSPHIRDWIKPTLRAPQTDSARQRNVHPINSGSKRHNHGSNPGFNSAASFKLRPVSKTENEPGWKHEWAAQPQLFYSGWSKNMDPNNYSSWNKNQKFRFLDIRYHFPVTQSLLLTFFRCYASK